MKDLDKLRQFLTGLLKDHSNVLKVVADTEVKFEVSGTVPTMQGKQKVDGIYFASVVPKPKDVRFYFFPMYTHSDALKPSMSPELAKRLKGKSCYHIKSLDENLQKELESLVAEAVKLYQNDGWLAK